MNDFSVFWLRGFLSSCVLRPTFCLGFSAQLFHARTLCIIALRICIGIKHTQPFLFMWTALGCILSGVNGAGHLVKVLAGCGSWNYP